MGVGNYLGKSAKYLLNVKFQNQTNIPSPTAQQPSQTNTIQEYQILLTDNQIWETKLSFEIVETTTQGDYLIVKSLRVNDQIFQVDSNSI